MISVLLWYESYNSYNYHHTNCGNNYNSINIYITEINNNNFIIPS